MPGLSITSTNGVSGGTARTGNGLSVQLPVSGARGARNRGISTLAGGRGKTTKKGSSGAFGGGGKGGGK
jgi:hypothetical protein